MPLDYWLQVTPGTPTTNQQAMLDSISEMLDAVRPQALDRHSSSLTWPSEDYLQLTLVHVSQPDWQVVTVMSDDYAEVGWLSAHDTIDEHDSADDRPWTKVAADLLAVLLRGAYEVEMTSRWGAWYRTRVIDMADPDEPRVLDSIYPLWAFALRPFPATITRERIDFDAQG